MPSRRSALVLFWQSLLLSVLVGCHSAPPPVVVAPPPPATEDDIATVQADIQQHDPAAVAGSVTAVRADDNLAAITLIGSASTPIKIGDTFTFIDSKQKPLANGSVVSIENSLLVVSYVANADGRAPKEGDIAVHLSSK